MKTYDLGKIGITPRKRPKAVHPNLTVNFSASREQTVPRDSWWLNVTPDGFTQRAIEHVVPDERSTHSKPID